MPALIRRCNVLSLMCSNAAASALVKFVMVLPDENIYVRQADPNGSGPAPRFLAASSHDRFDALASNLTDKLRFFCGRQTLVLAGLHGNRRDDSVSGRLPVGLRAGLIQGQPRPRIAAVLVDVANLRSVIALQVILEIYSPGAAEKIT